MVNIPWVTDQASVPEEPVAQPRVALALGGGSVRGGAHIGVLEVLQRHGFYPDLVTGTSVGALVGAFYAAGMPASEMLATASLLNVNTLLDTPPGPLDLAVVGSRVLLEAAGVQNRWLHPAPSGLTAGRLFEEWIREHLPVKTFRALPLPLAVVAADLRSGDRVLMVPRAWQPPTAEQQEDTVFLALADVASAVRASTSIPWVYTPKRLAGRLLIDGGVLEPVPAPTARLLGARRVIAVDLGYEAETLADIHGMSRVLSRAASISQRHLTKWQLATTADLVIRPHVRPLALTEVEAIPEMAAAGRAAAEAAMPDIARLFAEAEAS